MRLIKLYLREAKCPKCGKDGAYVGLNDVECPNKNCQAYKQGMDPVFSPLSPGPKIHGIDFDSIPDEEDDGIPFSVKDIVHDWIYGMIDWADDHPQADSSQDLENEWTRIKWKFQSDGYKMPQEVTDLYDEFVDITDNTSPGDAADMNAIDRLKKTARRAANAIEGA